jgi:hypothetical protein
MMQKLKTRNKLLDKDLGFYELSLIVKKYLHSSLLFSFLVAILVVIFSTIYLDNKYSAKQYLSLESVDKDIYLYDSLFDIKIFNFKIKNDISNQFNNDEKKVFSNVINTLKIINLSPSLLLLSYDAPSEEISIKLSSIIKNHINTNNKDYLVNLDTNLENYSNLFNKQIEKCNNYPDGVGSNCSALLIAKRSEYESIHEIKKKRVLMFISSEFSVRSVKSLTILFGVISFFMSFIGAYLFFIFFRNK